MLPYNEYMACRGPLEPDTCLRLQYVHQLMGLMRETFEAASSTLPRSSFLFLARGMVRAIGHAVMRLISAQEVRRGCRRVGGGGRRRAKGGGQAQGPGGC